MMSRNLSLVAAAVAAAVASTSASALPKQATVDAPVQLVIAGASAARDAFQVVIAQELCSQNAGAPADLTVYRATPSGGQDFRAYSCTLTAGDVGAPAGSIAKILGDQGIGGLPATFYYRSEGGSFWGPGSIVAKNLNPSFPGVKSLKIDPLSSDCGAESAVNYTIGAQTLTLQTSNCAVSGYSFLTDNFTSGALENKQVQLGVSDVEPKMFSATNYPQSSAFPAYADTFGSALVNLQRDTAFGQVFGILVNTTGAVTSTITDLTSAQITAIFSQGGYVNWNKIPGKPSAQIFKARREPGSGTQAAAAARFLHVNCGDSLNFVVDNGGSVREFNTSGLLNTHITNTANSIGIAGFTTSPPANTRFVSINGVAPSVDNVVNGTYDFAYELTTAKATDPTVLVPGSNSEKVANAMQTILKRLASIPDAPNVFAIPSALNTPGATNGNKKTAFASRNGNSCVPFQGK